MPFLPVLSDLNNNFVVFDYVCGLKPGHAMKFPFFVARNKVALKGEKQQPW